VLLFSRLVERGRRRGDAPLKPGLHFGSQFLRSGRLLVRRAARVPDLNDRDEAGERVSRTLVARKKPGHNLVGHTCSRTKRPAVLAARRMA